MSRKLFGCGLLLFVIIMLSMAGRVSSQDKQDSQKVGKVVDPFIGPGQANLDSLVKELKSVREKKVELDQREQQLIASIENGINEELKQLDQRVQERRARLEEIERLIHGDAKHRGGKAVDKGSFKK